MPIISKNIEIEKINNLSNEYIDKQFALLNLNVIRWAIVAVNDNKLIINVSTLDS